MARQWTREVSIDSDKAPHTVPRPLRQACLLAQCVSPRFGSSPCGQQPMNCSVALPLTPAGLVLQRPVFSWVLCATAMVAPDDQGQEPLGSGASSVVRTAVHRSSGRHVAVKSLDKAALLARHPLLLRDARREVEVMHHIGVHPNIVEVGLGAGRGAGGCPWPPMLPTVGDWVGGHRREGEARRRVDVKWM